MRARRVLVVLGTRPEAVKLAPVIRALHAEPRVEPVVCVTSQHREMLDQVLRLFEITPDHDLEVMMPDQDLADLTARALSRLAPLVREAAPAAVLVQGDTTTTLCGALAAFYQDVPVGHVEAGLRTGNLRAPFPEEMNRTVTSRLATWHFAPTEHNRATLRAEGVPDEAIVVTGNPVIDALHQIRDRIEAGRISPGTRALLERFARPLILVTGHRRESFGPPFEALLRGLAGLAAAHPEIDLVYPVHLNPRVWGPVHAALAGCANVHLVAPLDYEGFVALMHRSRFVITDSGGVQEEAPALGRPVLLMRGQTERIEALGRGVVMVGTDAERIRAESERLLGDPEHYARMARASSPYGDGRAAGRIASGLADRLAGA